MSEMCQLTPTFRQCTSVTTVVKFYSVNEMLILNFTLFTVNFFQISALALGIIC